MIEPGHQRRARPRGNTAVADFRRFAGRALGACLALILVSAAPGASDRATWYGIRLGAALPVSTIGGHTVPQSADIPIDAPAPWDAAVASTDEQGRVTGLSFVLYGAEAVSDDPATVIPRRRSVAAIRSLARTIEAELRHRLGAPNRAPEVAGERRWADGRGAISLFHTASLYANDDIIVLAINPPEMPEMPGNAPTP